MDGKVKICFITILLGMLSVNLWADRHANKETDPNVEQNPKPGESKVVTEQDVKGWALGCAAMLIERNHNSHDSLAPCRIDKINIDIYNKLLSDSWGINSREELMSVLNRLYYSGHNLDFHYLGVMLKTINESEYQELLNKYHGDQESLNKIRVVKINHEKLGPKGILGWDYTRYICLYRWSYVVGYLSEDEAWSKIITLAKILQETFDSWQDLGLNYLIGRQFYSYKYTKEEGYSFDDAYQRLIDMPTSPWNKYPWDMDLTDKNKVHDPNTLVLNK